MTLPAGRQGRYNRGAMPLYLVRWPGLEASIIRASSEEHLLDVIDEVGEPSECTWEVYRGPLWIDFTLPVKYEANERVPGRLQPADVVVEDVSKVVEGAVEVGPDSESETAAEMRDAVLSAAFPRVDAALATMDDAPDLAAVEAAVVEELVEHQRATEANGVTLDDDLRLLLTQARYYRRTAPGRFKPIDVQVFNDFCLGLAAIKPESDGLVRVACVDVVLRAKRPSHAALKPGVALRADSGGRIVDAHRADAFPTDAAEQPGSRRLRERRNEAVQWLPSDQDALALAALVRRAEKCELTLSAPSTN